MPESNFQICSSTTANRYISRSATNKLLAGISLHCLNFGYINAFNAVRNRASGERWDAPEAAMRGDDVEEKSAGGAKREIRGRSPVAEIILAER